MITIKKQEFVKFLNLLNEMRSSHSASQIENAGEEDNTPIDKTQEMGGLQLTTSLPDLTDPEWEPSSNTELRNALIAVSKEVPNTKLDDFYKRVMKAFEKTIDQLPEEENPFNPKQIAESLLYLFENKDEEDDDINKQVEKEMEDDNLDDDDYYDEKMRQIAFSSTGAPEARKEYEEDDSREEAEKLPSFSSIVAQDSDDDSDALAGLFASLGMDFDDDDDQDSDYSNIEADSSASDNKGTDDISDPFADLDFENMDIDEILAAVKDAEIQKDKEEERIDDPDVIEKERKAEDILQGYDPAGDVLVYFNELISAIKSFLFYKKIELMDKVYKSDNFKQFASNAGLDISSEKLYQGMSKGDAVAATLGSKKTRKNLAVITNNISAAYFHEPELIADLLAYNKLPDYLHKLAVFTDYPLKIDDPVVARTLATEGITELLGAVTNSDNLRKIVEKIQKESEDFAEATVAQMEDSFQSFEDPAAAREARKRNLINAEMQKRHDQILSSYTEKTGNSQEEAKEETIKKARESFMSLARYKENATYVSQLASGTREALQDSIMAFYFRMSQLGFYMMNSKIDFTSEKENVESTVTMTGDGRKRIKINKSAKPASAIGNTGKSGSIFQIFFSSSHPIKRAINDAITSFISSLPYEPDDEEFEFELEQMFDSEKGIAPPEKAIEVAQNISTKNFTNMDIYESWVWTTCYSYMYEVLKNVEVKRNDYRDKIMAPRKLSEYIAPSYSRNRPTVKSGETTSDWPLLSKNESDSVNSMLEGVDQQVYDTIFDLVNKTLESPSPNIRVLQKSSEETGGDLESSVPKEAFCYLTPFVFYRMWQKEISKHWWGAKRDKRTPEEAKTFQGEIRDMEAFLEKEGNYLKNLGPFVGMKNASGVQKMLRQYIGQRDYFLSAYLLGTEEETNPENPGGDAYSAALSEAFSSAAFSLNQFLEKYISTIKKARADIDDNDEVAEYWDEELATLEGVFNDMVEIDRILEEYGIWEIEEMHDADDELLFDIFDEDDEESETEKTSDRKFSNLNDKLDDLLHNTIAGHMLREIAHNSFIKSPKVSQSFLPELSDSMKTITSHLIINYPTFSFPNPAMNKWPPMLKLNSVGKFVEIFLGWQKCQLEQIRATTQNAMGLSTNITTQSFLNHGIDVEAYKKIRFTSAIIYDYIFAISLAMPRNYKKITKNFNLKQRLSSGQYGYKGQNLENVLKAIEDVIKKLEPSQIYNLSKNRIELISKAADDKAMFQVMADFIDSQINIAEINKEISNLKTRYDALLEIEIKKYLEANNVKREDLDIDVIEDIEKPVKKERKEILTLAKELNDTISKVEKQMTRPLEIIKK